MKTYFRSLRPLLVTVALVGLLSSSSVTQAQDEKPEPIRALLITGGCCHDYVKQHEAISKGIQSLANVRVDVYWTDNSTTAPVLPLYSKLNWAEGYDVIIHDECAAAIKDEALVNRIVRTHQKIPAVHLHCAMHSFRTGTDAWFKHLGLQSSGHGPQRPIDIEFVDTEHPITKTLSDWTTINEELYNNVKVFDAHPLAMGKQALGSGDNARVAEAIVAWTNESQGAKSFSTTIGHNTETVEDPRYLELITRGLLWSCDKLNSDYLQPYEGENSVVFIDKDKFKPIDDNNLGKVPDGATLVKMSASSTQNGHPPFHAIDGKRQTRWCADGATYPQWLQIEFEEPHKFTEVTIDWESRNATYRYKVEGSVDGDQWIGLLDKSENASGKQGAEALEDHEAVRFVRITGFGSNAGWCSLWEVRLKGDGVNQLWPADTNVKDKFVPLQGDPYESRGNITPRIEKLSAEEEAAILSDVTVPDGFEATVFASPPAVNYPVFVAAGVDGTLFVSSDGNGSLGRDPQRGRVIRLRDLDGDGRADETKVFCEVDAPRGLVWDRDRLYLMHPPNLSVFIDEDGDGVADEQKTLVKNLAFDYSKRPADHTTNGLSIGVDGWLYIAGGDFGFIDAEGTDGRKLTHRGGGVIRVRPDGTQLEIYSTGTRNILEVAISPNMEMFARDNTNDGGGWDVRLHHFTGMDDHGYPRLFKNFSDEIVQPLADYGGGSGCGAVYIDEPGFGEWNNAPFTADWGTGSLYRHTVEPNGATYQETKAPQPFIKMTRPTDADVDGNSRVYCASWKGATFNWAGPNVGYIVCVRPKDFTPEPMLDFDEASESELITVMNSPSYRRRMEAQRELVRRESEAWKELLIRAVVYRSKPRNILLQLQTVATNQKCVDALLSDDPVVVHTAIRCLAKREAFFECFKALDSGHPNQEAILRALAMMHNEAVVDQLISRLGQTTGEQKNGILAALCRLYHMEAEWNGDSWGTRPDTRGPYYEPVTWAESEKINAVLQQTLKDANPEEAAALLETMQKNRIQSSDSLRRMIRLAQTNDQLLDSLLIQLAEVRDLPEGALELLLKTSTRSDISPDTLNATLSVLSQLDESEAAEGMVAILSQLESSETSQEEFNRAKNTFVNSRKLQKHAEYFRELAKSDAATRRWGDVALLAMAGKKNVSPEVSELARLTLEEKWNVESGRADLIQSAVLANSHFFDDQILAVATSGDEAVKQTAADAIATLKIKAKAMDSSPKITSMPLEKAAELAVGMQGDIDVGKQLFAKANCVACHTVSQDEVQKGPFLGNIAKTYKRPELAVAILEPSKTIAQGFITNVIVTLDGIVLTGFVTEELGDRVTLRDQEGKEHLVMKEDIDERSTSTISVMPKGVMDEYTTHEMASLLDYLESLAK